MKFAFFSFDTILSGSNYRWFGAKELAAEKHHQWF